MSDREGERQGVSEKEGEREGEGERMREIEITVVS